MSQLTQKISIYQEEAKKLGLGLDNKLIEGVTKSLGPVIYNSDTELVSCSDPKELERVKKNFLAKKLQVPYDDVVYDKAIKAVCEKLGSSNRNKYRALFYALLTKEFGKESLYV